MNHLKNVHITKITYRKEIMKIHNCPKQHGEINSCEECPAYYDNCDGDEEE